MSASCLTFGSRAHPCKLEVIDWPRFNWKEYESITAIALNSLYENWIVQLHESNEDVNVLVIYCSRYQEARKELRDTVSEILETAKHGRHLSFSNTLLLSPLDNVTRKQDAEIKAALFRFITDTNRKL